MKRTAKLSKTTTKMVLLRAPVTINASADGEKQGPPTFTALAYSGGRVPGYTASPRLKHDYVIDLAGSTAIKTPKANLSHESDQRVGHITDVANDGKTLSVAGVLSAATPYREEVVNSAADGFPWEVSIEGNLSSVRELKAGKSETINGQVFKGPMYVIAKSQLTGIAFVSQGADEGNTVTIAASAAGEIQMTEFEKFIVSCGADPEVITDEHCAMLQTAYDAVKKNGKARGSDDLSFQAMAEAERLETKRQDEIKRMALQAIKDNRPMQEQIQTFAQEALDNGMDVRDFELQLLRNTRTKTGTFRSSGTPQTDAKVIEAALSLAVGLPKIEDHYSEATLDAVDRTGMRNFSLQQLMMQVAVANGYSCNAGQRIHTGNIREVLEFCFPPATMRLGFSTISLPGILGNVANKELLSGYMEEDQTWREIASVRPVNNFYQATSYRMMDNLEYEEVGPAGEIKHGTLGQESYTRQAKTYAKMLVLTRTDIINDDLGAFDDLRIRLGRGAGKKFNNIFWAAFMDNASFFTAALTNYISGSTTNLGTDAVGLQLAITAYRKMTTPSADGTKRVGVNLTRPSILLVPPELEFIARQFYVSINLITGASATIPDANIFSNLYRPVIQNRLSDSAFTGYSTTAFYLLGSELKAIAVSFLNGNQSPIVESTDADFDTLGVQFRGYHDFGCDKAEYLCGIKSKGGA